VNPEKPSKNLDTEIKKRGSFFETDEEGFVVNPTSSEKIQEQWRPAINDIVQWYKRHFQKNLQNVYIRGSVAKGRAVRGVSDIDTLAFVDLSREEIDKRLKNNSGRGILEKYPFVTDIELVVLPTEESKSQNSIILLNQSLCVYGEPLDVPKLKPGKEMVIHAPNIKNRIKKWKNFMKKEHTQDEMRDMCVWLMKGLLRSGCEIVMERSGKYTRDLYPCYEVFSEYYPAKEEKMKEALKLAINPTTNKGKVDEIMEDLGGWLQNEAEKQLS